MTRIIFIVQKKTIKGHQRSLDLALSYLKDNLQLSYRRWISLNGSTTRIGRSSYHHIVIPGIEDINSAISRFIPEFKAFEISHEFWRENKFHKSIVRNKMVSIGEDEKHFYIEVSINNNDLNS